MPTDAPTAFFSYSRDDSEFALRLAEDLKAAGASVWLDQLDIEPGQRWARAVQDALNSSPRVLVILSPSAAESTHVDDEVNFALEEHKTVIPVLFRDCKIPFQLRPFQYVDFRTDYARGLKVMLRTLGVEQKAAASAAAVPAAPKESPSPVLDEDERMRAEARALMEEAAEKARRELEDERRQVAEQARLEEERRLAAERARAEEERKQAAAEKSRLEQQERERLERERTVAPKSPEVSIVPPAFKKIALAVCGIVVVAFTLYWAMRPKQEEVKTQTPAVQTQPSSPPPAAETSSGSAAAEKATADKTAAEKEAGDKAAADKATARKAAADKAAAAKQPATESLSAQAMDEKGNDYYYGRNGVSKDYQQALSWFRKAAEAGDGEGMVYLGWMYENGYGVEKDYNRALAWYRKAAETGNAEGMGNLGGMYEKGDGVETDYQQALYWFRKAAEAGSSRGMRGLGWLYENGAGVEKDQKQAITWYRKAAQRGDQTAKDNLKRLGVSP